MPVFVVRACKEVEQRIADLRRVRTLLTMPSMGGARVAAPDLRGRIPRWW